MTESQPEIEVQQEPEGGWPERRRRPDRPRNSDEVDGITTNDDGIRKDAQGRTLCTAKRRGIGDECRSPAIRGTNVCRMHGGSAAQVKRKAQLRLLELIDPAVATLAREMVRASGSTDRQRAANSILDRAGVSRTIATPDSEAARDLLEERLRQLKAREVSSTVRSLEDLDEAADEDDLP